MDPIVSVSTPLNSHFPHSEDANQTSSFVQATTTLSLAYFCGYNPEVSTPNRSASFHLPNPACAAAVANQSEVPPSSLPCRSNDSTILTRLAVRNDISHIGASYEKGRRPVRRAVLSQTRINWGPSIFRILPTLMMSLSRKNFLKCSS